MTLYEELYHNTPNLSKFYRFEGFESFPYFKFQQDEYLTTMLNYIYFSGTERHHAYYVTKKLKHLIFKEILKDSTYHLNKKTLLDKVAFHEIESYIENYSFEDKLLSIQFDFLPIMDELLKKNTISNRRKEVNDRRIERVDHNISGGGYGFCEEWLKVFDLLTIFYSYQRITNENILDFLHMYRRNLITIQDKVNPVKFLFDSAPRVIKVNNKIYSDFSKYELMDALQKIVEFECYFAGSIFAKDPNEKIKKVIQEYNSKREHILELSDSIYNRVLKKKD